MGNAFLIIVILGVCVGVIVVTIKDILTKNI